MLFINSEYLSNKHSALLKLMDSVHAFLVQNNIEYSMADGSLLGTIRHQGFIPWDDDMDIMMTREMFNKMMSLMLDNNYGLKIVRNIWLPRVESISIDSASIDIFIVDSVPDNVFFRKIKILLLKILQGMIKEKVDYSNVSIIYFPALFFTHLFGKFFSKDKLFKWYDKVSTFKNDKIGKCVFVSNDEFKLLNVFYDSNLMSSFLKRDFEDRVFFITSCFDEFLTKMYGKYLELPPEAERVPTHNN